MRLVHLTAWTVSGGHIIGYDEKRGHNRTFSRKKINRLIISKTPAAVSYTHLDVYKRQT